ncbi:MAG TPA: glycosyltransferase family 4 protein [Candidatus Saccharimonadales bacterium]
MGKPSKTAPHATNTSPKAASNRLKIGLVLDDTLDTPDGVQQYVLALGTWLSKEGHDVHYLVGQTLRTDVKNVNSLSRNVKVRFNGNRMSIPLPASKRRLKAFLKVENFDVIHVQMPYSPFLAGRLIRLLGPRTVLIGTFHVAPQSRLVHLANHALGWINRRTAKRFDRIISVSTAAQDFVRSTLHVPSEVIPNAIDLAPFFDATPFPQYKDVKTIVFVGRLVERKGCQHLLRAAKALKNLPNAPKFQVIVCGRGPLEASLKQYVAANGLEDVVYFAGWIAEADKPRYVASADIAIYPSTGGESFGIVLLEGMAAARGMTLGGDNPGYRSLLIEHPEVLFDAHDDVQLAATLAALLQDDKARARAHEWQRKFAGKFDITVVGRELLDVYTSALRARRS